MSGCRNFLRGLVLSLAGWALGACGGSACDNAECLTASLAEATAGTRIELTEGTFTGSFVVRAGVTVTGAGAGVSIIDSNGYDPGLVIQTGTSVTTIENLGITAGPKGGIFANGGGDLTLNEVAVSAVGGVGFRAEGLSSLSIKALELSGNVAASQFGTITLNPDPNDFAVAGLVIRSTGNAALDDITATGFAAYGALIEDTPTTWNDGEVHGVVGTGIYISGSVEATFTGVNVHDVADGATPFGYGIVATGGVHLVTDGLSAKDNRVAGVLMDHATGQHTNVAITGNGSRGIWIQYCAATTERPVAVELSGSATTLDGNKGIAFGVYQSTGVSLLGGYLGQTGIISIVEYGSAGGRVDMGDGVQIIDSNGLVFRDLLIENNERAGLILDGDPDFAGGTLPSIDILFDNVTIDGTGDRGFVLQNGTSASTPDVVSTSLQAADTAGGDLAVAKQLAPGDLPSPVDLLGIIDSNG